MYRTVEFWFYSGRDQVRVEITRGGRGDVSHFSHEYKEPTKASLKRLQEVLGTMSEGRPENVHMNFWTNGTATSTELTVYGRLEQSESERKGREVVDGFMRDIAEGAGPHEVIANFFDNVFQPRPLADL